MKRWKLSVSVGGLAVFIILFAFLTSDAHRSGCHRWHSCPSDRGTYICGDLGYCSRCPDNQYCLGGRPRPKPSPTIRPRKGESTKPSLPAVGVTGSYGNFINVKFIRCYDGDTCTFNIPYVHPLLGKKISVRFRGIDTAEIKGKCPEENALAKEAKKLVNQILSQASRIDLVEVGRGKYFRILASVVADGKDLGAILIERKLAVKYSGGRKKGWCE